MKKLLLTAMVVLMAIPAFGQRINIGDLNRLLSSWPYNIGIGGNLTVAGTFGVTGTFTTSGLLGVGTATPYHDISNYVATPDLVLTDTDANLNVGSAAEAIDTASVAISASGADAWIAVRAFKGLVKKPSYEEVGLDSLGTIKNTPPFAVFVSINQAASCRV